MVRLILFSLLSVCPFFLATGCGYLCSPNVWITEDGSFTVSASGLETLDIDTHNGEIVVRGAEGTNEIEVHAIKRAGGFDETDVAECMKSFHVVSRVEGTRHKLGWEWTVSDNELRRKGWQAGVSFEIFLPPDLCIQATTHNGSITLDHMSSGAKLMTHNGRLVVEDLEGDLIATTHNESISVVDVSSSNLRLETHNGSIKAGLSDVASTHGHMITHDGGIKVGLGENPSVRLHMETHNGGFDVAHELSDIRETEVSLDGTIGSGEGILDIRTYNGSISIK